MKGIGKSACLLFIGYFCMIACGWAQNAEIIIQGSYSNFMGDSLELRYWTALPNSRTVEKAYSKQIIAIDGEKGFSFRLLSQEPVYVELIHHLRNNHQRTAMSNYIAEPGDNIRMDVKNDTVGMKYGGQFAFFKQEIIFKGQGSEKFRCKNRLDLIKKEASGSSPSIPDIYKDSKLMGKISWSYRRALLKLQEMEDFFQTYQDSISPKIYKMLWLDIRADRLNLFYRHLNLMVHQLTFATADERKVFEAFYRTTFGNPDSVSAEEISASVEYPSYLLNRYRFESKYFKKYSILEYINKEDTRSLKERLLTEYFVLNYDKIEEKNTLDEYIAKVASPVYRRLLIDLGKHQVKGKRLGDYEFIDMNGKSVRISDFKDKVVFLDFWFTGCGGCLGYYRDIVSKVEERLTGRSDVVFMTVSIDVDKNKWIQSVYSGKYTNESAINLYTNGKGSRHPVIDDLGIEGYPRPIVIDRQGNIYNNNRGDLRTSPQRLEEVILSALE